MSAHTSPIKRQTPTDGPSAEEDQPPLKKVATDSMEVDEEDNDQDIKKMSLQQVISANYPPAITALWKDCHRFYQCTPFTLFPPDSNLQFDEEELWTEPFCSSLRKLLWLPPYVDSILMLAVVLQYAIICRTEDSRYWSPSLLICDDGHFLMYEWFDKLWRAAYNTLVQSEAAFGRGVSSWMVHRFVRDEVMTTNVQRTSMPSVVFSELEENLAMGESDTGVARTGPYVVTQDILTEVLQAMEWVMVRCGVPLFPHGKLELPEVDAPWPTTSWMPK